MKGKLLLILLVCFLAWPVWSQDFDSMQARQIMDQEEKLYNAASESFVIHMALISGLDDQAKPDRVITMQMWLANQANLQSSLLKVSAPATLQGMGVLTVQKSASQTFQQLYLPEIGTRIIGSSKKSDRFMASDITFGDLEPEVLDRWEYLRLPDEVLNSQNCYVLEARPRDSQDIGNFGYSRRKIWLQPNNYFILKMEYYDPEGQLAKIQLNQDIVRVGEYWRSNRMVVQNLSARHLTVLTFSERKIKPVFPENFFSQRYLEMDLQAILRSLP